LKVAILQQQQRDIELRRNANAKSKGIFDGLEVIMDGREAVAHYTE
jgi:hypothetical protein